MEHVSCSSRNADVSFPTTAKSLNQNEDALMTSTAAREDVETPNCPDLSSSDLIRPLVSPVTSPTFRIPR